MEAPQKTKFRTTPDPAILLLGIYLDVTTTQKRYIHPFVPTSTIHNSQDKETDEWIKKM